jgi:hypothetical protein
MSFAHYSILVSLTLAAAFATGQPARAQPLACRYEVSAVLQAPSCGFGGVSTIGTAINPSGTTVVGYRFCLGTAVPWKWTQETGLVMLTLPPWLVEGTPTDVNDNNIMVGTGFGPVGSGKRGFVCDLNTMTWSELMPQNPPLGWSEATGINSRNVVVGYRTLDDGGEPVTPFNACIWHPVQGVTDLGVMNGPNSSASDIADDDTVVGWTGPSQTNVAARAFVYTATGTVVLPPVPNGTATRALAAASSDDIAIIGRVQTSPTTTANRAFLFSNGEFSSMGVLRPFDISASEDVNTSAVVVGVLATSPPTDTRGFVWQAGLMRDLDDLLVKTEPFTITHGIAISANGKVVAAAYSITLLLDPIHVAGDALPDCIVNTDDLIAVILAWGQFACPADVTGDGVVDADDLTVVILNWSF